MEAVVEVVVAVATAENVDSLAVHHRCVAPTGRRRGALRLHLLPGARLKLKPVEVVEVLTRVVAAENVHVALLSPPPSMVR